MTVKSPIYSVPTEVTTVPLGNGNGGGGGLLLAANATTVYNCYIAGNTASFGGGVFARANNKVYDCVIVNNTANTGSGISFDARDTGVSIYNVTVANNHAVVAGGSGVVFSGNTANRIQTLSNAVLYNNTDVEDEVVNISISETTAGQAKPVIKNVIIDKDYSTANVNLAATAAVIETDASKIFDTTTYLPVDGFVGQDAGDATGWTFAGDKDLAGNARTVNIIDIGPYETSKYKVETTVAGGAVLTDGTDGYYEYNTEIQLKFTVPALHAVTAQVNGSLVIPTEDTDVTNGYILNVTVEGTTAITIMAGAPKQVTVTTSDKVTITTPTGDSPYPVAEGSTFIVKFTVAEGYVPSVSANATLSAPDAEGVYTATTVAVVTENTIIEITTELKQLAVSFTWGTGVAASGTPAGAVTYFGNYEFSFTVATGYHLPVVKVDGASQPLSAPAGNVYTVTLTDVRTAKNITVGAYADNVIPVTEDTYVRKGSSRDDENFSNSATLEVRDYDATMLCRSFLKFDLPAGISISDYTIELNVTLATLSNGGYAFALRGGMPDDLKTQFATMTWNNAGLPDVPAEEIIVAKTAVSETAGTTLSRDVTDYVVANAAGGAIYIQISDGGTGFTRFHSHEAADYTLVPQLVLTPADLTGMANVTDNDPVLETKYYNLQGQQTPALIKGIYIVKQIHVSGKTTITKQLK